MPSGSRKGERRGGRQKATPNKLNAMRVERVERQGRILPPEDMLRAADRALDMVEHYQPEVTDPATGGKGPNPNFIEERYAVWLGRWIEALKAAAPYYAPRLMAMAIQGSLQVEDKEEHADPRQVMWEIYKQMRERGELGLKALAPPPAKVNGGEGQPVTIEAKTEEEDDGDGVAT
jgi:hypothetical protein